MPGFFGSKIRVESGFEIVLSFWVMDESAIFPGLKSWATIMLSTEVDAGILEEVTDVRIETSITAKIALMPDLPCER
jgi:hypothetical protein